MVACCGKKSQNIPKFNDLEACFGFNPIDVNAADICEVCRRAVQEYRSTGKIFHHVSVFILLPVFIFSKAFYDRTPNLS